MFSVKISFLAVSSLVVLTCQGLTLPLVSSAVGAAWTATQALPTPTSAVQELNTTVVLGASIPLPSDYISTVLFQHNAHRANHSANPLVYDMTLACSADSIMEGTPGACPASLNDPGNLFTLETSASNYGVAAMLTASAINTWYNEEQTYAAASQDYTVEPDTDNFESWGHFSQMVWAGNLAVGCWATFCGPGTDFLDQFGAGFAQGSGV